MPYESLLAQERAARQAAEAALEATRRELFDTNVELQTLIVGLDEAVAKRTAEMLAARDRAIAADSAKSAFLANMSHEIRTPLTSIIGFAELMLDQRRLTSIGRGEALSTILRNARHLLELISDILDLSKIEADGLELDVQDVDLPGLLAEIESMLGPRAREKGLQFDVCPQLPLPRSIRGDKVRLKQIIVNFCSNSIKFTESGTVQIEVIHDRATRRLEIAVVDTGIGMTEGQIARLFQPFTQADVSTTRRFGGTGLGLYISRQLAELMGATIEVRSAAGQGSRFALCLTLDDGPTGPLVHEAVEFSRGTELFRPDDQDWVPALRGRVLLAEDGPHNQRLIGALIEATGAELTLVDNGESAFQEALGGEFDLVLMDIQMPVMDGLTAIRLLREAGYASPVVALTANVMRSDIESYRQAGCNDALGKPIDRRRMYGVLARHLAAAVGEVEQPLQVGDKIDAVVSRLAGEFRDELPQRIATLELLLARREWPRLRSEVHAIKGVAGSIGYPQLTRLAQPAELAIIDQRYEEAELQCALLLDAARAIVECPSC
ncbi:MAG: response regulator [Burkholderiales bacterium]|nr:response regulator [Burkholderiales bacterium]MDE1925744.1 response regulator [Burkholderiales bacterium]MDE2502580.1 response regulator [Burkholderiales bacterium]